MIFCLDGQCNKFKFNLQKRGWCKVPNIYANFLIASPVPGSISNTTDQSKNQISGSQLSQQLGRQAVAQLMKSKHTGQSNVSSPQQSPASAPKTGGSGVGTGVTIHNAYSLNSLGNASSGGGNHKNLTKSQQKYHQHQVCR